MPEALPTHPHAGAHTGCTCSEATASADPVLDARTIPPAIRHAAIFGALDSLTGGAAMVLVAPHRSPPAA